jgi:hypothetical protein
MSRCFRPVKEVWNLHSSCFVEPKALITLLHDLAARVVTPSDEHNYGDNTVVWFEDGNKVLDYIETDGRFYAESFKDSLEEQGMSMNTDEVDEVSEPCCAIAQHAKPGLAVADFSRRTRGTGVRYRCLLKSCVLGFRHILSPARTQILDAASLISPHNARASTPTHSESRKAVCAPLI